MKNLMKFLRTTQSWWINNFTMYCLAVSFRIFQSGFQIGLCLLTSADLLFVSVILITFTQPSWWNILCYTIYIRLETYYQVIKCGFTFNLWQTFEQIHIWKQYCYTITKWYNTIKSCKLEDVKHSWDKIQISCYKADEEQNLIFKLHRWELKTPVRMFLLDNSLSDNTNTRTSHYTHCTRHNTSLQTMLYNSPVTEYFSLSHYFPWNHTCI